MKRLVIFGAGGHGKVVADIASKVYEEILFFVDKANTDSCLGYPVSDDEDLMSRYMENSDFFVAIGNRITKATVRSRLVYKKQNFFIFF